MASALEVIPPKQETKPTAIIPTTFKGAMEMATVLAKSTIIPKAFRGKPNDVFVALELGAELGFPPMASLRHIFVLPSGGVGIGAQALHAVASSAPDCEFFRRNHAKSEHGKIEVWECKRRGRDEIHVGQFTIEDAKRAGLLGKDNWKHYTADMLENRAIARCARRAYPEKVGGLHTQEEIIDLGEVAPNTFAAPPVDNSVVVVNNPAEAGAVPCETEPEPPVSKLTAEQQAELAAEVVQLKAAFRSAANRETLESKVKQCQRIKGQDLALGEELLAAYMERLAELEAEAKDAAGNQ